MQDFEKELKLRRIQERDHIEKSTEENLYENQAKARKIQDQKIHALNVIQKAVNEGELEKDVFMKAVGKVVNN
jgi:hypothetical protein